jgi:hypothetical protein
MKVLSYILFVALALATVGCGTFTRVERDVYTITEIDTTVASHVQNQPNDRNNGVIYPSSRTIAIDRKITQRDSVKERFYPGFIRLGVFEGIGLIGSSINKHSTYTGLFGLYYDIDRLLYSDKYRLDTTESALFSGYIYRFGIGEWKIHWFNEDPNWTWGITAFESIRPDANIDNALAGISVLTIRKRFYLSSKIPYIAITPALSLSAFPSQYVNASVSADIGSIAGVNLRLYTGYVFGQPSFTPPTNFITFPYLGLGVSMMDFLNREEELDVEWKYHEHSGWEIGGVDGLLLGGNVDASFFDATQTGDQRPALTGFSVRVLNARIALPVLDHRLTVGTSLINFLAMGNTEYGIGVLPIRVSYFSNPLNNAFVAEPFVEFNYAPSTFVHLGVRGALPISDQLSLQIVAAYASGSTGSAMQLGLDTEPAPGVGSDATNFNAFYIGIGASFFDRIFHKGELRYGKGYPHE